LITILSLLYSLFFFFTNTPSTYIYTLSLHDALPILTLTIDVRITWFTLHKSPRNPYHISSHMSLRSMSTHHLTVTTYWHLDKRLDRKSTRLNSSHVAISYAVFCLKKKIKKQ